MKKIEEAKMEDAWLLHELAHRCAKVEELSKDLEFKPVRGKDHMWVEGVTEKGYLVYWRGLRDNMWYAFVLDMEGKVLEAWEHDEPFDYREVLKEWLE